MTKKKKSPTDNWKQVRKRAVAVLPKEVVKLIGDVQKSDTRPRSRLITVLHRLQAIEGHLGPEELQAVALLLGVPAAKVTGVATFYHFFRTVPRGRFMVSVCMGTACYVRGAEEVRGRVAEELGIADGQTTSDGLFSLQDTRCVGTCGLAPVVMVNDDVHGNVTPSQVPAILELYRARVATPDRAAPDRPSASA